MAAIGEAVALIPAARGQITSRSRLRAALILIAPASALLLAIFVYPFLYALYISFTEWTLGQQLNPVWSGLANYASLVHDVRAGNRSSQLLLNRVHQVFKRVRPLMLDTVDKECRCAVHITTSPTLDVALHALHIHMRCQITLKPLDIKADVGRIMGKVVISQRILVIEQLVMHLPEPALR